MKSARFLPFVLGIAVVSSFSAIAEEPAVTLPKDGWWIRYLATAKHIHGEQTQELKHQATYSLVGTGIENGETCRWVELKSVQSSSDSEQVVITKFLVSESDLLKGEEPVDAFKRAWSRIGDRKTRSIDKNGRGMGAFRGQLMIFPGMWRESELVKKERIVDYQHGKLTIPDARVRKVTTLNRPDPKKSDEQKRVVEFIGWFDQKTAPAFTAVRIETKIYEKEEQVGTSEFDMTVQDFGTDAKTELPEGNRSSGEKRRGETLRHGGNRDILGAVTRSVGTDCGS